MGLANPHPNPNPNPNPNPIPNPNPNPNQVPNAVFSYDISPYRVVHREERQSLGSFLTQLCAIVGGCFTVFGLIDSALFYGVKAVKQD